MIYRTNKAEIPSGEAVSKIRKEEKADLNAWMVTFGDLLMLLLTFFVLLLTMKNTDQVKAREMFDHILQYSNGKQIEFVPIVGGGPSFENGKTKVAPIKVKNTTVLSSLIDRINGLQAIPVKGGNKNLKELIEITDDKRGVKVIIESDRVFKSGSDQIKKESVPMLNAVGKLFRFVENDIIIMGHTDNVPISVKKFPSNWELSVHRALSVLKFLTSNNVGLRAERLATGGFGKISPRFPNDTPKHRAINRRVEFILIKEM